VLGRTSIDLSLAPSILAPQSSRGFGAAQLNNAPQLPPLRIEC
jgi:hypothetical protein